MNSLQVLPDKYCAITQLEYPGRMGQSLGVSWTLLWSKSDHLALVVGVEVVFKSGTTANHHATIRKDVDLVPTYSWVLAEHIAPEKHRPRGFASDGSTRVCIHLSSALCQPPVVTTGVRFALALTLARSVCSNGAAHVLALPSRLVALIGGAYPAGTVQFAFSAGRNVVGKGFAAVQCGSSDPRGYRPGTRSCRACPREIGSRTLRLCRIPSARSWSPSGACSCSPLL